MKNGKNWSKEYSEWYKQENNTNPFEIFEKLIYYLKNNKKYFNFIKLENLLEKNDKINIGFRFDIDCDINTAIKCSKFMEVNKIPNTFYVLHTGIYYRNVENKTKLERHIDLKENILNISNQYSSIGLHIDPLHVYIKLNQNGSKEVINEINWLNTFCKVKTICSHNSCGVFGAENFEIFEELTLNKRKSFSFDNIEYPLGTLKLQDLDLIEINYPIIKNTEKVRLFPKNIDKKETMKMSVHDNDVFYHKYNINIWCCGNEEWLISNNLDNYYDIVNFDQVISYLDSIKNNSSNIIVFNIHPIYFSL